MEYRIELWKNLEGGERERVRFVESHLSRYLAFQIRAMRVARDWSQEELAQRTGMNQNMIYRLENPAYGRPTLSTLKRVAEAFDVGLVVRFVPFRQMVDWVSSTPFVDNGLSTHSLAVPSFGKEQIYDYNPLKEYQRRVAKSSGLPSGQLELGLGNSRVINIEVYKKNKPSPTEIRIEGTRAPHREQEVAI